jgi:glycerol-3-phosphate dehydrogenase
VHLVVPRDRIVSDSGLILRTEKSVLFVIPWGRHWIIGTTDTAWDLDLAHPAASRTDIDYLLERVNTVLNVPLDHDDVEGVYAGLRPLLAGKPGRGVGSAGEGEARSATQKVSREHTVVSPLPGLVLIAGGKLTTYRIMARDAVDLAVRDRPEVPRSQTERVPLLGADGFLARTNQRVALSRRSGLEVGRIDHLLGRYGGLVDEVLDLIEARPALGVPLPGTEDYLAAEVVYAVTHEGARHLDDVLARRTRISIETFDRGTVAVTAAADLMAAELGWDPTRRDAEVDHYLRRVEAERQSQQMLTDQEADEARVSAPDIV